MRQIFVILIIASAFTVINCGRTNTIEKNNVDYIELVQVDHPYIGHILDSIKLDESLVADFLKDFAEKKEYICKFYSCYVIKIHLKDGQLISYRTNGQVLEKFIDKNTKENYFKLNSDINLVTKYWGISKENFCDTSTLEQRICDIVYALPEVKERACYIKKETKGKRHLRIEITQTPKESDEKYYWVRVGEVNDIAFVTHFNFIVYPDNFKIKYYDTINDTIISLETWRKEIKNGL